MTTFDLRTSPEDTSALVGDVPVADREPAETRGDHDDESHLIRGYD
ncbi:hypothetical protein [Saccharopolyspora sp. CA-218241]